MNGCLSDQLADVVAGERFAALDNGRTIRYCPTDGVMAWMRGIPADREPFTMVTHNGDTPVTESMWASRHPSVVEWFAVNSQTERCDRFAGRSKTQFRVVPQVSDDEDFIQSVSQTLLLENQKVNRLFFFCND